MVVDCWPVGTGVFACKVLDSDALMMTIDRKVSDLSSGYRESKSSRTSCLLLAKC